MKVQIASDLHGEFYDYNPIGSLLEPVGDVLVLAGDIFVPRSKLHAREFLQTICDRWKKVIYVPGNHEFYNNTLQDVKDWLNFAEAQISNLHFLDNKMVEIEGKRFLGGTLWFPQKPDPYRAWELMNDFELIKDLKGWVYEENNKTVQYLLKETKPGDFVITHHLPMFRCVQPQWAKSATNLFFVGDADEVIVTKEPKYWVYGHTHTASRMTFMQTELICNPRGYPGQSGAALRFDQKLVVEY